MDTTHRKIELQSPADYHYLHSNATRRAAQRLDVHFPPLAADSLSSPTKTQQTSTTKGNDGAKSESEQRKGKDGEVDMRTRVEELVAAYLEATFGGLRGNIVVNGLEGEEMGRVLEGGRGGVIEDIEPYDHKLAKRIQDTSSQIEALTLQLANARREAPAEAARRYQENLARDSEAWVTQMRSAEEEQMRRAQAVGLDVKGLERQEEMKRSWERSTANLVDVKDGIGGTVARLERARDLVGYIGGAAS